MKSKNSVLCIFCRWSTSLDSLTLILADAINEIFQEIPAFSESLRYEALLGVTINNKTTFVFSLQGFAGQVVNITTGLFSNEN